MILIYPGPGPQPAVAMVAKARHEVRLNTYELTSKPLERALAAAAKRGVKVRIMLDRAPWRGAKIVSKEFAWCRMANMDCKRSPKRFRYDHAKYLVADGTAWIGTMNFTYSGFHRDRDAALVTRAAPVVEAASAVFDADWSGGKAPASARRHLVLSPGAEPTFANLLRSHAGPVEVETEELGHLPRLGLILQALGKRLRLILPARLSKYERRSACALAGSGVRVRTLRSPYVHIKLILTGKYAFLGSENFSYTSLYKNREAGIVMKASAAGGRLAHLFDSDWGRAQPIDCQGGR